MEQKTDYLSELLLWKEKIKKYENNLKKLKEKLNKDVNNKSTKSSTNKIIEIKGVNIDKIVDGKIVEHSGAANTFEAFWENGLISPV